MKSGWKLHLASWIGALGVAFFISSASYAAPVFTFDTPGTQTSPSQSQIGGQGAGFTNNFDIQLNNQPYDLTISIVNISDPNSILANLMIAFDAGGSSVSPLLVSNVLEGLHIIHVTGLTGGTGDQNASYQVRVEASQVAQTPIPAAALLFGSGLAVLGVARRRKKAA